MRINPFSGTLTCFQGSENKSSSQHPSAPVDIPPGVMAPLMERHGQALLHEAVSNYAKQQTQHNGNPLLSYAWIRQLLKAGNDPNPKSPQGFPLVNYVLPLEQPSLTRLFNTHKVKMVGKSEIEETHRLLRSQIESLHPDYSRIQELLKKPGLNLNQPSLDGLSIFDRALYQNDLESVQLLLSAGASANQLNRVFGITPLLTALNRVELPTEIEANSKIIQHLLDCGANPDFCAPNGQIPLVRAAKSNLTNKLEMLLNAGAKVNQSDAEGDTALHKAISAHQNDEDDYIATTLLKARLLLTHGANPNQPNHKGITPLQLARQTGVDELVELFEQHNAAQSKPDKTPVLKRPLLYAVRLKAWVNKLLSSKQPNASN